LIHLEQLTNPRTRTEYRPDRNKAVAALQSLCWASAYDPPLQTPIETLTLSGTGTGWLQHTYRSGAPCRFYPGESVASAEFLYSVRDVWQALNEDRNDYGIYLVTESTLTEVPSTQPTEADRQFGLYLADLVSAEYPTDVPTDAELAESKSCDWLLD
jgi:hypothetical protein